MISSLGKITRNMPNIPHKDKVVRLFQSIKSKKPLLIGDYQKTMKLSLDINSDMQSRLFWFGYHHLEENRFLSRMFRPHHVFLDIGANFGEFTILAAKYITEGEIFSFEPGPVAFRHLKSNCDLNKLKNVHLFECALGSDEKKANLYYPDLKSCSNEGLASLRPVLKEEENFHSVSVRCLDRIPEIADLNRIDVVKIDVEGAELRVLEGGIKIFTQHAPLMVIEISEARFNTFGYTTKDLLNFLLNIKPYIFFRFHLDGGLIPISSEDLIEEAVHKKNYSFNIACI